MKKSLVRKFITLRNCTHQCPTGATGNLVHILDEKNISMNQQEIQMNKLKISDDEISVFLTHCMNVNNVVRVYKFKTHNTCQISKRAWSM